MNKLEELIGELKSRSDMVGKDPTDYYKLIWCVITATMVVKEYDAVGVPMVPHGAICQGCKFYRETIRHERCNRCARRFKDQYRCES